MRHSLWGILEAAAAGNKVISDAIALYDLVRRAYQGRNILSALFDADGKRLAGDERLAVEMHQLEGNPAVWWYSVAPVDDYHFIRIPVNAGAVVESLGTPQDQRNADAAYFRYVGVPDGRIYGGQIPNVRVSFMVAAYRPTDLLAITELKGA
jgi:hypothetical protein